MRITVVGAGYVGLVTAAGLAHEGHRVYLVERLEERVKQLSRGQVPFYEPGLGEMLGQTLESGALSVTGDLTLSVRESQVTFVAVGTPLAAGGIDLSQISEAAADIGRALHNHDDYHVVVIKSTVVPGSSDTLVRELLEKHSGLSAGQFGLCMNPEFLREGCAIDDFLKPDRIIIGQWDERSGQTLKSVYEGYSCPIIQTSLRNAELTKYATNSLLSVLISFSNEFSSLCEKIAGTDIETVMQGLHLDKRLSPVLMGQRVSPQILSYLRAGCGFGGSCLPKDVSALRAFADSLGVNTPMLDAAIEVNQNRPGQVISLLQKSLGSISDKIVSVLGIAFKPGTDDFRESPALKIAELLESKGAKVRAYDPMVSPEALRAKGIFVDCFESVESAVSGADAAVIATAWTDLSTLDWTVLAKQMRRPLLLDGRRLLSNSMLPPDILYQPIGVCQQFDAKSGETGNVQ